MNHFLGFLTISSFLAIFVTFGNFMPNHPKNARGAKKIFLDS